MIVGVVTLVVGMVVSYLFMVFPSVAADYQNASVMRQWSDPLMSLFALYPFIQGIIFAWVWDKTKKLFSGKSIDRGINFGASVWLAAILPGMLVSYSSFPLSLLTIFSWTIDGFICSVISGLIFVKMNE